MSGTLKTIVIGTSLTGASDRIVRIGEAVARKTGASPWLLHSYMPPVSLPENEPLEARWLEQQTEDLQAGLREQARRTGLSSLAGFQPGQLRLVLGSPPREIVSLARQVKADLIILGASEGGGLHRVFLGSTADRVIRKAPCPVLVIRSEAAFPPTRVEIPVDLSPISANSFHQGMSFLSQLGVPLTETEALFALNPFEVGGSIHFTPEQIERFAREELRRFVQTYSPGPAPSLLQVRTGYARETILDTLQRRKVDLAILGTLGRSGFERLTVGSVAAQVMHEAGCNLLIVPPEARLWSPDKEREDADWRFVSDETPVGAGAA